MKKEEMLKLELRRTGRATNKETGFGTFRQSKHVQGSHE